MSKNAINSISLLLFVLIVTLTSCSGSKRYAHRTSTKYRTERTKKSPVRVTADKAVSSSASGKRLSIVSTAKKYIGKSYVYGGKKPSTGFDCSGFTSHVFKDNGIDISGPSYLQAKKGKKKSMDELQKGDLVFFGKNKKVTHVAIVADVNQNNIKVIHSTSSRGVVMDDISSSDYWQKRYLFGRDVLN